MALLTVNPVQPVSLMARTTYSIGHEYRWKKLAGFRNCDDWNSVRNTALIL